MRYDANGNILALQRRGLLAAATRTSSQRYGAVDNLMYSYVGNRLQAVEDAVTGNALPQPAGSVAALTSLAGDFQEKAHTRQEYGYDQTGNLIADANKGIRSIRYNHLNLPEQVKFSDRDFIEFRYAASGQKVAKLVHQSGRLAATQTDYLGAYQYEGDSLRFFPHAEGRVLRVVQRSEAGIVSVRYVREYALKDHLGNLRVAYRPGEGASYTASMEEEPASRARREEHQWDSLSIVRTRFLAGGLAKTGGYVARLNAGGATPHPLGPLKMQAVHKGDKIRFTAPGRYSQPVASNSNFLFSLASWVAALVQPAPAPTVGAEGNRRLRPLPFLGIGVGLVPALTRHNNGVPLGYARLLVFDADSNLVSSQTQTRQLSELAAGGYEDLKLEVTVAQDGYVQAYVGNESEVDVLFDDVTFTYEPALLVQENQYDPWGLNLAGIERTTGIKPLNQYQFNGKERQLDLGLNWNDHGWRFYDPQLGRWAVVDPDAEEGDQESWTTYQFGLDNAVRYNDLDGRQAGDGEKDGRKRNNKEVAETAKKLPAKDSRKYQLGAKVGSIAVS